MIDIGLRDSLAAWVRTRRIPIAILALPVALTLWAAASYAQAIPLRYSTNPNEGWNAYHTLALLQGGDLYPPPDAFVTNNYPPLSFHLVGAATRVVGDPILAGRLLAAASLVALFVMFYVAARRLGARPSVATVAMIVLFAIFGGPYRSYVVIDDPQWLTQAFTMAALVAALPLAPGVSDGWLRRAAPAAWIGLAMLCKHSAVALPIALALWAAVHDRTRFWLWLGMAALALPATGLVLWLAYGPDVYLGVLDHERVIALWRVRWGIEKFLVPILPWVVLGAVGLASRWREAPVQLVAAYYLAALATGLAFLVGDGVYHNVLFDLAIAAALGIAVGLEGLVASLVARRALSGRGAGATAFAASAALTLLCGRVAAVAADDLETRRDAVRTQAPIIAAVQATDGLVICNPAALCLWAGKPYALDAFNTSQKLATGRLDPLAFAALVRAGHWSAVAQHCRWPIGPWPAPVRDALRDTFGDDVMSACRPRVLVRRPG